MLAALLGAAVTISSATAAPSGQAMNNRLALRCWAIGVETYTCHDLRRSHVSDALEPAMPLSSRLPATTATENAPSARQPTPCMCLTPRLTRARLWSPSLSGPATAAP